MKNHFVFGGGLASCISEFIHPIKLIMEKYSNRVKTNKLNKLVFIAEAKKKIQRNSGVSNVYTFSHAYFEGVKFTPQAAMCI